jgi:hypothetical protein
MEEEFDPLRLLAGLRSHGVTYVLVGGLASAARGSTITLDDVDIVIPPADEDNLGNLGLALAHLGAEPIGEDDAHRSSYLTAAGPLDVIELGEAYDGLAERATTEDLGNGVVARVASTADLMELKRASGDLMGAAHLAALAHVDEDPEQSEAEHDADAKEPSGPKWFQKMWTAFEDVDTYLSKVVYGDDKMHG